MWTLRAAARRVGVGSVATEQRFMAAWATVGGGEAGGDVSRPGKWSPHGCDVT